jgi:hypothetical protein
MNQEYTYLYDYDTKCMIRECRIFNIPCPELNIMIDLVNNTITHKDIKVELAVTDQLIFLEFIKNILATDEQMESLLKELVANKFYNDFLLTNKCYAPNSLLWFH